MLSEWTAFVSAHGVEVYLNLSHFRTWSTPVRIVTVGVGVMHEMFIWVVSISHTERVTINTTLMKHIYRSRVSIYFNIQIRRWIYIGKGYLIFINNSCKATQWFRRHLVENEKVKSCILHGLWNIFQRSKNYDL